LKKQYRYPLNRNNHRNLPADFQGHIYIWDIDKTYLNTNFSRLRDLVSIAMETALDKRSIPGAATLLRELRRGTGQTIQQNPIYFISASPPQIRASLEKKMTIDGVEFDGITLKDQLQHIKQGKWQKIKKQIGFKLSALLLYNLEFPLGAVQWLFGDDSEDDVVIYDLYSRILSGKMGEKDNLDQTLKQLGVEADEREYILSLAQKTKGGKVGGIFIHLATDSDPEKFSQYGSRVTATTNYLQTALKLFSLKILTRPGLSKIIKDLHSAWGYSSEQMAAISSQAVARKMALPSVLELVKEELDAL